MVRVGFVPKTIDLQATSCSVIDAGCRVRSIRQIVLLLCVVAAAVEPKTVTSSTETSPSSAPADTSTITKYLQDFISGGAS
jgi:hypothetical protein